MKISDIKFWMREVNGFASDFNEAFHEWDADRLERAYLQYTRALLIILENDSIAKACINEEVYAIKNPPSKLSHNTNPDYVMTHWKD